MVAAKRSSNLDALRCLAMFFIVCGHFWHGGVPTDRYGAIIHALFTSVTVVGVNIFLLLSGYLQATRTECRYAKVFDIWRQTAFYSAGFFLVFCGLGWHSFTHVGLLKSLLPILTNAYWFITVYVVICLVSPYLNRLFATLTHGDFTQLLMVLLFLFSICPTFLPRGMALNPIFNSSAIWAVVMYTIGVFLRFTPPPKSIRQHLHG